jgi:hypothetical protein
MTRTSGFNRKSPKSGRWRLNKKGPTVHPGGAEVQSWDGCLQHRVECAEFSLRIAKPKIGPAEGAKARPTRPYALEVIHRADPAEQRTRAGRVRCK